MIIRFKAGSTENADTFSCTLATFGCNLTTKSCFCPNFGLLLFCDQKTIRISFYLQRNVMAE